ncbi:MAG: DUF485 domain-containing protein [Planctomycetota bacterium]
MLHEPAAPVGEDRAEGYKTKLGVRLFWVYAVVYAGFTLINIIKPVAMEKIIVFGLNLAVVYGFGLILVALILALLYNRACSKREAQMNAPEGAVPPAAAEASAGADGKEG